MTCRLWTTATRRRSNRAAAARDGRDTGRPRRLGQEAKYVEAWSVHPPIVCYGRGAVSIGTHNLGAVAIIILAIIVGVVIYLIRKRRSHS